MKNFQNYKPEKYSNYKKVEDDIYLKYFPDLGCELYVTSLTFEMENECYGEEEASPQDISQVPFEDLLDDFNVCVTDFYDELNENSEKTCYQEFGSRDIEDIRKLRTLIGKRYYAVPYSDEADEEYRTVIE